MISRIKTAIENRIITKEGGQMFSGTLRKLTYERYHVNVGLYSYGGCFNADFNIGGLEVSVGRYCSFAQHIHYYGASHPFEKAVMSPFFYNRTLGLDVVDVQRSSLNIGNDVWIGDGVIITRNCTSIGDGAVIGAGTIVTKDVPAFSIFYGNPGVIHKYRFSNIEMDALKKSKWWLKSPNELMDFYQYMDNPLLFAEKIMQKSGDQSL